MDLQQSFGGAAATGGYEGRGGASAAQVVTRPEELCHRDVLKSCVICFFGELIAAQDLALGHAGHATGWLGKKAYCLGFCGYGLQMPQSSHVCTVWLECMLLLFLSATV